MPPRDYFTDEIRRQLSEKFGDEQLFTGGLTIRATVDPDLQAVAADALRDGLEQYDRGLKVYRGPVAQIDPASFDPNDEQSWRAALGGDAGAARHRRLASGGGAGGRRERRRGSGSRARRRRRRATS